MSLLLLLTLVAVNAFAYSFHHPASQRLTALVQESFAARARARRNSLKIEEIDRAYAELPRTEVPLEELRELKFLLQYWRWKTNDYLTRQLGEEGLVPRYVGPESFPDIPPIKGSKFSFDVWSQDPSLSISGYESHDGEIWFRGLKIRSGDILLADQNAKDGDGLFTSLVVEPKLASHVGQVVFLKKNGLVFPAVIEIHEKGLRAVPLNVFLSPQFMNYVEVFRVKNPPSDWEDRLSREGLDFLKEPHSYDLWAGEQDPRYLTCTNVALNLLRRTGAPEPAHRSTIEPDSSKRISRLSVLPPIRFSRRPISPATRVTSLSASSTISKLRPILQTRCLQTR